MHRDLTSCVKKDKCNNPDKFIEKEYASEIIKRREIECDLKSRKRKKNKKRVLSIEQGYKIIYKEQGSNKKKIK